MVSTEKIIAIVEICVYIPVFIATLIVVFRHGFKRQLGWIYLIIFCAVRLAGAGFKIASVENPTNTTDLEWASILQSVGLSPLIMASMGLLKRITDQVSYHIKGATSSFIMDTIAQNSGVGKRLVGPAIADSRRSRTIQLAQLPTTIALILCVVGGINEASTKVSDQSEGKAELKVGIAIFLVIYVLLFSLVVITMKDVGNAPRGEKRIYFAVLTALPLLAVRLLWSVLAVFGHDSDFSIQGGKPFTQLFMAIIEEFIIVLMYTIAGLTVSN